MTSGDIEMEDASNASIEPFRDMYETLLCTATAIENDYLDVIIDENGKTIEVEPTIEGTNVLQYDYEGFEWKREDGVFWKREAVNLEVVPDEPEWFQAEPNQRVRTDLGEKPPPMSDDERFTLVEKSVFDPFDEVIKHIFFNKSIRERGTKLTTEDPARTLIMARKKSLGHIQPLIFAAAKMQTEDVLELFEILCSFVKHGIDDAKAGEEFDFEETLCKTVVIGIAHVLQHFRGEKLADILVEAWDGLMSWCLHFAEEVYQKQDDRIAQTLGVLIGHGVQDDRILKKIGSNRGLLRFLTEEWTRRRDEEDGYATRNLLFLCSNDKIKERVHNLILRFHWGLEDNTAEQIIRRILTIASLEFVMPKSLKILRERKFPLTYKKLLNEIKFMRTFCEEGLKKPSATQTRLILDDFFIEVTRVIRGRFVARFPARESEHYPAAVQCAFEFNKFYEDAFYYHPGGAYIFRMACRGGYIWHLFKLTTHLDSSDICVPLVNLLRKLLTITMPAMLWYSTTQARASEDFRRIFTERGWEKIQSGPLAKEWTHFHASLLEGAAYKHFYEKGIGSFPYDSSFFCDNLGCEKTAYEVTFKRCGGCKRTLYCSKTCQTIDWKCGHKKLCKDLESSSKDNLETRKYIDYHIHRDAMRLLPGIRNLALETFGNQSLADVGVEMDYTVYPAHVRVFRLRPSWQYQKVKYEVTDYKRLGARAKAGKDDVFLVKAKVAPVINRFPMQVFVPFRLLDDFIVPEADRPTSKPQGYTRTTMVDPKGEVLETIPFDKVDAYLAERQFKLEPWEEPVFPPPQRQHVRELFDMPKMPEEYPSSDEDDGEKKGKKKPLPLKFPALCLDPKPSDKSELISVSRVDSTV